MQGEVAEGTGWMDGWMDGWQELGEKPKTKGLRSANQTNSLRCPSVPFQTRCVFFLFFLTMLVMYYMKSENAILVLCVSSEPLLGYTKYSITSYLWFLKLSVLF